MEEAFKKYVLNFDMNIPEINYKYYHSLRVRDLCKEIAEYLKLTEEETILVKQIGLLHDIGRFEQWKRFKSYHDPDSIDHGDLGVDILFNNNFINEFNINDNLDIIYKAIKYHNKYELPKLDSYTELFCNIVRDSDKIDILFLISNNDYNILNNTNDEVTNINREDFYSGKSISNENVKNANDHILCVLAFMNHFNFNISKEYVLKNKYLEKIYENSKYKEPLKEYFEKLGVIKC
ncbi:MAG: HD domain-containing protein [Ignavibacteriales bacterium]